MIFALVGFLVAAFVCVTIVNASLLNAQRAASEDEEEQAYLAVTSAAKVLRQAIGDARYKKTIASGSSESEEEISLGFEDKSGTSTDDHDELKTIIISLINEGGSKTIEISGVNGIPDVKGYITMDESYSLRADLISEVKNGNRIMGSCEMVVIFRGAYNEIKDDFGNVTEEGIMWPKDGVYIVSTKSKDNSD